MKCPILVQACTHNLTHTHIDNGLRDNLYQIQIFYECAAKACALKPLSLPPPPLLQLKTIKCKCHTSGHSVLEVCVSLTAGVFLHTVYLSAILVTEISDLFWLRSTLICLVQTFLQDSGEEEEIF